MADYWAHVERDADSLRGEERMHLGVAAQCEGANLVRLERIEGEGADKGHVHTQGAVLPSALYAQQGAIRDGDPGRVFQQRLAPGRGLGCGWAAKGEPWPPRSGGRRQ